MRDNSLVSRVNVHLLPQDRLEDCLILLDPKTGLPLEPLFQVDISPSNDTVLQLSDHGMRLTLQIPRRYESFAAWGVRRVMRFVQKTLLAR